MNQFFIHSRDIKLFGLKIRVNNIILKILEV